VSALLSSEEWRGYFRGSGRDLGDRFLPALLSIGAVLSLAGLAGVVWAAGLHKVWHAFVRADWSFIVIAPIGIVISHLGYTLAYREVAQKEDHPNLALREAFTIVTSGFGPISPRGGFALDLRELRKRGLPKHEAEARVRVLGMLEYAVLAPAALAAASFMLVSGTRAQVGLLPSWVIGVPVGAVVTFLLLYRFKKAGRPNSWWGPVRHWLDAIGHLLDLLRAWPQGALALAGMAIYWAGEIAALGGCLDVFVHRRGSVAVMIVGYATGYALTRRSLPLGSAGVVEALMPFALTWVGFPLPSAILAVVAYRAFNLWLPMIPAVTGLKRLRELRPETRDAVHS
jgi:uncharacterized membrane protein YbhN (UPF0104 family)